MSWFGETAWKLQVPTNKKNESRARNIALPTTASIFLSRAVRIRHNQYRSNWQHYCDRLRIVTTLFAGTSSSVCVFLFKSFHISLKFLAYSLVCLFQIQWPQTNTHTHTYTLSHVFRRKEKVIHSRQNTECTVPSHIWPDKCDITLITKLHDTGKKPFCGTYASSWRC